MFHKKIARKLDFCLEDRKLDLVHTLLYLILSRTDGVVAFVY